MCRRYGYRGIARTILVCILLTVPAHTGQFDDGSCSANDALRWLQLGINLGTGVDPGTKETVMLASLLRRLETDSASSQPTAQHPPTLARIPWLLEPIDPPRLTPLPGPAAVDGVRITNDPLASVESETFWIEIGSPDAAGIYMFVDPVCPYCGQAMALLAPAVTEGELVLRIVLSPVLGRRSIELAASMMLADDPAGAIWQHELAKTTNQGEMPKPPADVIERIGESGQRLLASNMAWMAGHGFESVPLFVWASDEGWHSAVGVQHPITFTGAVPVTPSPTGVGPLR